MRRAILLAIVALCATAPAAHAQDSLDPGKAESLELESGGKVYPYVVYTPTSYAAKRRLRSW